MAAKREYEAVLALGARLQGSFGAAFGAAKKQLQGLGKVAQSIGKALAPVWRGISLGLGMLAAKAGVDIFKRIFGGADEAAKAALARTQQLTAALTSHPQLQKLGTDVIKGQVLALQKVSAELGKIGVVHSDHYEQASRTLALYGQSPVQISKMLPVLGDTLVATKGVNASVEQMQELVGAVTTAIGTGQTKALKSVGILMDDNQKKAFKSMNATQRQTKLVEILTQKYKGANEAAADTDLGKIQRMQNMMAAFSESIGLEMVPMQAKFASFWTEILPAIEPLAKTVFKGISLAMGDTATFAKDVVVPALNTLKAFFEGETFAHVVGVLGDSFNRLGEALKPLAGIFGLTMEEGRNFGHIMGDLITGGVIALVVAIEGATATIKFFGDAWNLAGDAINAIGAAVNAQAANILSAAESIKKAWEGIGTIFEAVKEAVLKALAGIAEAIGNALLAPARQVQGAWEGVKSFFGGGGKKAPAVPGAQYGGIFQRPTVRQIAEAGVPEAVIPLQRSARSRGLLGAAAAAIGGAAGPGRLANMSSRSSLNFAPVITIGGNADAGTVEQLDRSLRSLADDFLSRWNRSLEQEERLSFST